jgi:hypothetical protein
VEWAPASGAPVAVGGGEPVNEDQGQYAFPLVRRKNLSDLTDAAVARTNLGIGAYGSRLDAIEALNTTQNTRLTAVEGVNTTQDTRLTNLESATSYSRGGLWTNYSPTIPSAATTDISWPTEWIDGDSWVAGGATLTSPVRGFYLFTFYGEWLGGVSGATYRIFCYNSGTIIAENYMTVPGYAYVTVNRWLEAAQTIKFAAYQNNGYGVGLACRLDMCLVAK